MNLPPLRDGSPYFNPSFGNRPLRIVGRETEIAAIEAGLRGAPGTELRAPIIIGQRSFGKTALLIEAERIATGLGFVCAGVAVRRSMLRDVLDGLCAAGGKALKSRARIDEVSVGALGFNLGIGVSREPEGATGFQARLGDILDGLEEAGLGACILVDEVQPDFEELRELTQTYQHYAGRGRNIALIMAGLPRCISKTLNDKVSTFLFRAERLVLGLLPIDDVYLYFAQAFEQLGIHFVGDGMMRAARATGGMPYMMQLLGRNIASLAPVDGSVSGDVVDEALMLSRDKLQRNVFAPCLDTMSRRDVELACAMLADNGVSRASDLKERLRMDDETYQQTRRRNIDNGIIEARGYGVVAFSMPYFADWLRQERENI